MHWPYQLRLISDTLFLRSFIQDGLTALDISCNNKTFDTITRYITVVAHTQHSVLPQTPSPSTPTDNKENCSFNSSSSSDAFSSTPLTKYCNYFQLNFDAIIYSSEVEKAISSSSDSSSVVVETSSSDESDSDNSVVEIVVKGNANKIALASSENEKLSNFMLAIKNRKSIDNNTLPGAYRSNVQPCGYSLFTKVITMDTTEDDDSGPDVIEVTDEDDDEEDDSDHTISPPRQGEEQT